MNILIIIALILFIIMAVCVILFTAMFVVAGVNIIKAIKEVREIGRRAKMFQLFIRNLISKII